MTANETLFDRFSAWLITQWQRRRSTKDKFVVIVPTAGSSSVNRFPRVHTGSWLRTLIELRLKSKKPQAWLIYDHLKITYVHLSSPESLALLNPHLSEMRRRYFSLARK